MLAMAFALLIYERPEEFASRTAGEDHPYLGAWRAYRQAVGEAGIVGGGDVLDLPETAATVRVERGRPQVQDGPYADSKEQLAGFLVLEVESREEALEWAARCPAAALGRVEVRPLARARARQITG
jgi:hypothetical protein